jgi:hypothetical protein
LVCGATGMGCLVKSQLLAQHFQLPGAAHDVQATAALR